MLGFLDSIRALGAGAPALAVLAGLAALFGGGELLVRGAVALARRARIRPLLVGLTVVAFATSAPELVVSIDATLHGMPAIALGNIVGTNLANLGLVLGVAALVSPIAADWRDVSRDVWVMLGATLLLVAGSIGGVIGRLEGAVFLLALGAYIALSYRAELRARTGREDWRIEEIEQLAVGRHRWPVALSMVAGGVVVLAFGAEFLVTGASEIASSFGVSDAVIGLTVVAVGTSLPELATCVVATAKGNDDVAIGNAVGSNVFNILLILGTASVARPLAVPAEFGWAMAALLAATAGFAVYVWRAPTVTRTGGAVLLVAYAVLIGVSVLG